MAGADLFGEKSVVGWLLVVGLLREKSDKSNEQVIICSTDYGRAFCCKVCMLLFPHPAAG
jgi:hypothetical protein